MAAGSEVGTAVDLAAGLAGCRENNDCWFLIRWFRFVHFLSVVRLSTGALQLCGGDAHMCWLLECPTVGEAVMQQAMHDTHIAYNGCCNPQLGQQRHRHARWMLPHARSLMAQLDSRWRWRGAAGTQ